MRTIDECNPLEYSCFYYIASKSAISVYKRNPNSDELIEDVHQFLTNNGSIIAFKKYSRYSTDMAYIAKYEDKEQLIQYQIYENMLDIFSGADADSNRHYLLFSSRAFDTSKNQPVLDSDERCDSQTYSALLFWELTDGSDSPLTDNLSVKKDNLQEVFVALSVPGSANIVRLTFREVSGTYVNFPVVTTTARSLLGSLRLACEWQECTKEPFNSTEYPALKIAEFVEKLGINEGIKNSIYLSQEPMAVAKFLSEPENSRIPSVENGVLPSEVLLWLKGIIRYRTLNSLARETGVIGEIPEEILLLEKASIASEVFKLCVQANIEFETMTYDDIRNAVSTFDNVSIGSSPGECVEKMSGL